MNILQSNIDYLTTKIENNNFANEEDKFKYEQGGKQLTQQQAPSSQRDVEHFDIDTMQQPMTTSSDSVSPSSSFKYDLYGGNNHQSRRESLHDTHRRLSQQSFGQLPVESSAANFIGSDQSGDKYVQDSFETEKIKSNRTSPNAEDDQSHPREVRRKGSIRFYDEVQSFEEKKGIEASPEYTKDEYDYGKNLQQQAQQEYTDPTGYDQSDSIIKAGQYDTSQYIDQQNYDENQYGAGDLQSTNEYEYQYTQNYDQSGYQADEQPSELLYQPEQYVDGQYQQIVSLGSTLELEKHQPTQQQQNFPQLTSSNSEMDRKYKGNGNNTVSSRQPVSKPPSKKKFT
ncbi:putative mediator of RNA polymerase II transcription subunit 26 [Sitodiplosis mosellana]|uniref:putative mediator of RNA polymerase II transcription subunit 26 n=1 Tax=Sitodiplosis mosellana TaxID=263140 RepID=UPI002443DB2C|nr:putative mediator of RNA polymerase II transcription subunit 26 [Sitodiplosis mosellana]